MVNKLRKIRLREGISEITVSRAIGKSLGGLQKLEDPSNLNVTLRDLQLHSQALHVPVSELVGDDDNPVLNLTGFVLDRAKLIKVYKWLLLLEETTEENSDIWNITQMAKKELQCMMPELNGRINAVDFGSRRCPTNDPISPLEEKAIPSFYFSDFLTEESAVG